jgi:hypothetical protein
MYVRYSDHGKISNKFLALKNIARANAENVATLIETTLKEYGGFTDANLYKKLVGFGADGASVNMGSHNGIGARLQRMAPTDVSALYGTPTGTGIQESYPR